MAAASGAATADDVGCVSVAESDTPSLAGVD